MRKTLYLGSLPIGGGHPIAVQSMTNTKTRDCEATVGQIRRLEEAGCEAVRVAVPAQEDAEALEGIVEQSGIPVIADIHFDHRLALQSLRNGVQGLRLNPGNMKDRKGILDVVEEAAQRDVPIRVGVNAGSVDRSRFPVITPEAMVESALFHIRILEETGFDKIKVSLKSHDVFLTLESYRLFSTLRDYPLHAGITEAGFGISGLMRSAAGLSLLLQEGLADTLRISLTGDPVQEVEAAFALLDALNLRRRGVTLISCPTCGRTEIDLEKMAYLVKEELSTVKEPLTVAVMGCAVNGPGEAADADFGIAGGKKEGLIFVKGKVIGKYPEAELVKRLKDVIMEELRRKR
ncbi:MAG TPA: flavodoxin-dependent (E)-4-hydroxy-3-methylbut-2-enyl-diphosphate synthase [Firmicutes bacterium]|nr:flavodoxin-dependent (E)-4-hydroxy-3-methylbut-2-enyl-diphosphate synthase [Bacillota bacterium]